MRKSWKSWAKVIKVVTNAHQNVQKQRISQYRIDFLSARGGGGGSSKMAKSPTKRSSSWSKVTVFDRYWAQMRPIRAHPERNRMSSNANLVKSDQIGCKELMNRR